MATVTISGVSKSFNGTAALHPLDLTVEDGSFCCMLGSSGSGKSTLLRIIAGLSDPDTGTVRIGERDVTRAPSEKRRIGFVFQNYALFPHLSVGTNVAFGLRARGVGKKEAHTRADRMLELVGLAGFGKRTPKQLSGGQQQRVALARALVTEPDVLLLDEPLSALDRKIRGEMQAELKRIHHETGLTTIMVTHDQEEAMNLGDSVLMLSHGRVQQFDTPETLYREPANGFVAGFLGAVPLGNGIIRKKDGGTDTGKATDTATTAGSTEIEIDGTRLRLAASTLTDGTPAEAVVMAERVALTPASERPRNEDEHEGIVTSLDFYGPFARAEARLGSLTVPAMMLSQHAHSIEPEQRVWIRIAPGGLHAYAAQEATRS
ncbi:ABC transporter ATP-binding protein [Streptomyces shenzhenensis]|uniref:ABC transporter ATP-binding protein n=1 Tax=Streptomyces shenzhenensis TaxID=943815 RepID=UPI00380CA854